MREPGARTGAALWADGVLRPHDTISGRRKNQPANCPR
ncbi:hypothetical protein STXM2123_5683 [Streptomyces sp. F-3]|nr:hypothetical protein STXM2123_5683 [Streptomyces sp. F-3]